MTQQLGLVLPERCDFGGSTYREARDGERLRGLLLRVYSAMSDGQWHTLSELAQKCGGSEASVSARLRDLRKPRFGGYTVDRRRVSGGLFEYRVTKETGVEKC